MKKSNCMFCGALATLLCDHLIGYDAEEDKNGMMLNMPRKLHTCDAPMCRSCATWHGNIFFSGSAGFNDTRDYCPICEALFTEGRKIRDHRQPDVTREPCLTDEQAHVIREAHWNSHLNEHRRSLVALKGGGQLTLF